MSVANAGIKIDTHIINFCFKRIKLRLKAVESAVNFAEFIVDFRSELIEFSVHLDPELLKCLQYSLITETDFHSQCPWNPGNL